MIDRSYFARARMCALLALGAAAPLMRARAQDLPLKRPSLSAITVSCPTFPAPPVPVAQVVDEANRLATLGQEASIEGDHRAARDLFKQATQLDSHDPSLAYRLAREYEGLQQRDDAVHEYCRYLSLAPTAADAPQIVDRIAKLLPGATLAHGGEVVRQFRTALASYDAHNWSGAADAFGRVLVSDPTLAAAAYDRALARLQDGQNADAIRDFSHYLQLEPQAKDAAAVRQRIRTLRSGIPRSSTAFAVGLLPGGGQFYTGQPVLGVAVIAATAGGVVLAARTKSVTKDTLFSGPFGGTYPGTVTHTQRPTLALGVAVAGGVTLLGAIEAALVAHGRSAGAASADTIAPARTALLPHAGPLTVQFPTVMPAPDGLRLAFPLQVKF